ncbi:MAG: hypothetical protein WDO73_00290 [Ignavibacteriota bacterium]
MMKKLLVAVLLCASLTLAQGRGGKRGGSETTSEIAWEAVQSRPTGSRISPAP